MGQRQSTMEKMEEPMNSDNTFWKGKRVFLTGHTGFKGSWLSLWLQRLGADVYGFALEPQTKPSLFKEARVSEGMTSIIGDTRNPEQVRKAIQQSQADIVLHLAAQALVRLSYDEPVSTFETNVMGTVNLLEAAKGTPSVRAIVNVTTDKCYENKEWEWGYREHEPMGGHDPYSASKGCSELVTSAYRRSYFNGKGVPLASARAGNVIGGGDWSNDRIIPDILKAFGNGESVEIRSPHAIRPWQHVLEPLSGYLSLAQKLYEADGLTYAEGWNFGPHDEDARPVQWIVEQMAKKWDDKVSWQIDDAETPHEANYLKLDISKARKRLYWKPRWTLDQALEKITYWHQAWLAHKDMRQICEEQINQYTQTPTK